MHRVHNFHLLLEVTKSLEKCGSRGALLGESGRYWVVRCVWWNLKFFVFRFWILALFIAFVGVASFGSGIFLLTGLVHGKASLTRCSTVPFIAVA